MAAPMPKKPVDSPSSDNDSSKKAIDPVALGQALAAAVDRSLPLLKDYMEKHKAELHTASMEPFVELQERITAFMAVLMTNPRRLAE